MSAIERKTKVDCDGVDCKETIEINWNFDPNDITKMPLLVEKAAIDASGWFVETRGTPVLFLCPNCKDRTGRE
jgi:hypothetical protein